jgi:hypothetical protein
MSRFKDRLWRELVREHGAEFEQISGPAPRATRSARPRLLTGTTIGAAATATVLALVLSAAGSSPAFAVTHNRDGSYSVTLRALNAIPAANAKLVRMGVPARFVQVRGTCTNTVPLPGNTAPRTAAARSIRIPPRALRHNRLLVIAAWRQARTVQIAPVSVTARGGPSSGNSLPTGNTPAKSIQVRCGAAALARQQQRQQRKSGSSDQSGSGNSGNS